MTDTRSGGPYAAWSKDGLPFTIAYSLPALHEIDFLVNEGFRRIPYGGIEHGGLLFGGRNGNSLKMDSFRQIECEHAAGPGFSLSPKDMEGIKAQLQNSAADPELRDLEPIGFFISCSRRDLAPSPADLSNFSSLFTEPWQVLLLVKPEKFNPSRFVYTFPNQSERDPKALDAEPFSVPLPGRAENPEQAAPGKAVVFEVKAPQPRIPRQPRKATKSRPALALPLAEATPLRPQSAIGPAAPEQPRPVPVMTGRRAPLLFAALSVILIAACGFWFYQTYEVPAIQLHVTRTGPGVLVSWPAEESSGASEAELRIWKGRAKQVIRLSATEKNAGLAAIRTESGDMTIELVSHHWMQNRRGMTRLLGVIP